MRYLIYIFMLVLPLVFISCGGNNPIKNGIPDKLIIGVYSGDNPVQTKAKNIAFQKYLEKELGLPVEFIYTTDYTSLIEGIQRKKLHIAQLSPFAYVLATRKKCLVPLVTIGLDNQPSTYHSCIISSSKSTIKTMEDLRKQVHTLSLCFADPASASGHLIPRAYLKSIGLEPDSNFKQVVFAGSHAAAVMSVVSGKIDIGCTTNDLMLNKLVEQGAIKKDDYNILWISDGIVNDVISASLDLSPDFRAKIAKAYLAVNKKDSIAFSGSIFRLYKDTRLMQFIPAQDSMYTTVRNIAETIKELKLIQ